MMRRDWSLRRVGKGVGRWWAGVVVNCLLPGGDHVVLHRSRAGRNGSLVPGGRLLLGLLDSFHRPGMGVRDGMELCLAVVDRLSAGNCCCSHYGGLLAFVNLSGGLGGDFLGVGGQHQLFRRASIR